MSEQILLGLKWGSVKFCKGVEEGTPAHDALVRYYEDPVSMSAAAQKDTDNQQQAVLDLIDAVADAGGEIYSDWSGETYTRETAKQYILEYGK